MSNNLYTSPRLYASRYKPKVKTKRTFYEMGSGYALNALPPGMSRADFKKLYKEWEEKLKQSGFHDLEYRAPSQTGFVTPFFRENGSTATFMRMYDASKEEYFSLATHFDSYMSEVIRFRCPITFKKLQLTRWRIVFDDKAWVYKKLWYFHIEGVPYRAIARAVSGKRDPVSGKPDRWIEGLKPWPRRKKMPASVFWAHNNMQLVLNLFWKWMSDKGYTKDPRDEYVSRKPKKVRVPEP